MKFLQILIGILLALTVVKNWACRHDIIRVVYYHKTELMENTSRNEKTKTPSDSSYGDLK